MYNEKVDNQKVIRFEHGLIGMPEHKLFELRKFDEKHKFAQFLLLQSLDDPHFGLLLYPVRHSNKFYTQDELAMCNCSSKTLLLVTKWNKNEQLEFTSNLQSPIIIDTELRDAKQIVFPNPKYSVVSPTSDIVKLDI